MARHVAFLRGVNLGKRQTRSADLKAVFEGLGFTGVRTLISSGNVVFETRTAKDLARRIEAALEARFGFAIHLLLRSAEELASMVADHPFADAPQADVAFHVLLAAEPFDPPPALAGVTGDFDVARITQRELFFVVHKKSDGTFLGRSALSDIDRQLPKGIVVTMRNWNTILKAAAP